MGNLLDELMTGAEVAKLLGVSRQRVSYLVGQGRVPCLRKGLRVFFVRGVIERQFAKEISRARAETEASQSRRTLEL